MNDSSYFVDSSLEWEEISNNTERIYIGHSTLPRYSTVDYLVAVLTLEGCPTDYALFNTLLLSLPSLSTPSILFTEVVKRFNCRNVMPDISLSALEQVQLKVMIFLRHWSRSSSASYDFSGNLIHTIIDFLSEVINSSKTFPSVKVAAKKVRAIAKTIRDDLQSLDLAQSLYKARVLNMNISKKGEYIDVDGDDHAITFYYDDESLRKSDLEKLNVSDSSALTVNELYQHRADSMDISTSYVGRSSFASVSLNENSFETISPLTTKSSQRFVESNEDNEELESRYDNADLNRPFSISERSNIQVQNINSGRLTSPISGNNHDHVREYKLFENFMASYSVVKTMKFSELANYLTIIEYEYCLLSIRPRELVDKAWTKHDIKSIHPDLGGAANVSRSSFISNQVIGWVAREIIDYVRYIGSANEAIEYFLKVSKAVFKLNNFNTNFHIITALNLPAVQRLRIGWKNVSSKEMKLFFKYSKLHNGISNSCEYRNTLHAVPSNEPCIPCIHVVLKDIFMLEQSLPWKIGGKVDVKKALSLQSIVSSYLRYEEGNTPKYSISIHKETNREKVLFQNCNDFNDFNFNQVMTTPKSTVSFKSMLEDEKSSVAGLGGDLIRSPTLKYDDKMHAPIQQVLQSSSPSKLNNTYAGLNELSPLGMESVTSTSPLRFKSTNRSQSSALNEMIHDASDNNLPSFLFNCKVVQDSFFQPLRDSKHFKFKSGHSLSPYSIQNNEFDIDSKTNCLDDDFVEFNNHMSASPTRKLYPSSNSDKSAVKVASNSPASTRSSMGNNSPSVFASFWPFNKKSSTAQNIEERFTLCGEDESLARLQKRIFRLDADLKLLWEDSKLVDNIEYARIFGKLEVAGLF